MAEQNIGDNKAFIRREMTKKRNDLPEELRKVWSKAACERAKAFLESRSASSFMAYVPFRSELDLSGLIEWGWQTGRTVIVPRCVAADFTMTLHVLHGWGELIPGAYGIMEPNPAVTLPIEDGYAPEAVFVPGLAFDRSGGRLGYGGGYYDRFAAALQQREADGRIAWIGAAFEAQLLDRIPREAHDLPMDAVLTERTVYMA
ncbi:5-formyltetrahydrofolate cyclo-ligase [Paenibacillus arenilitoris]|uniref:5-formyltetrahydrofolate cyclo-ligase n=1 Tax=Paenibacillus arenilitoris TaxID=2772299 RepID=A0A927CNV5_9BACL|nr:5-formyltetrahydrofolate cyclo-ligase [Paenibacillus arenilitoris]MBD2870999.1 5-formyltetrahydrofolate cyclo-ligase [Paenibacillus arenilitoris]